MWTEYDRRTLVGQTTINSGTARSIDGNLELEFPRFAFGGMLAKAPRAFT
jgi:hypothetical protein